MLETSCRQNISGIIPVCLMGWETQRNKFFYWGTLSKASPEQVLPGHLLIKAEIRLFQIKLCYIPFDAKFDADFKYV